MENGNIVNRYGLLTNKIYSEAELNAIDKRSAKSLRLLVNKFLRTNKATFLAKKINIYLYGPNRVGKTWFLHALSNYIINEYKIKSLYFITAPKLYKIYIKNPIKDDNTTWINFIATRKILILDDLGQEYRAKSGFAETNFEELIRWRFNNSRITIISGNATPKTIKEVYGQSFSNFIEGEYIAYEIREDINMSKLKLVERI